MDDFQVDVLVVGAGNAAACAALAARETGASVPMLEAAPEEERGGNSTYTAGAMRLCSTASTTSPSSTTSPRTRSATSISAPTRPTSSSTTWAG